MPSISLTPEVLASIAGAALSLAFSYIPGLNTRFASYTDTVKRLFMSALLLVVSASLYGLQCVQVITIGIACTQAGAFQIVWIWLMAIVFNQSAYSISPRAAAVQQAKANAASAQPTA